ncbi:40S ribosomal protein mrp10 [Zalaria obscura]|uniref:40S ribosomal protein mrp10 n=1 Tax=Zalaria obscura TaxID=2024903 RepID=A0ACC3SJ15_9PEZI
MVVKNTQAVTRAAAPRLPPLPKLRVRRPDQANANPCIGMMSSVLGCWASSGYTTQGCAALEQQLRACMDAPRPKQQKKSTINYHLSRLYPQIIGPHKRK